MRGKKESLLPNNDIGKDEKLASILNFCNHQRYNTRSLGGTEIGSKITRSSSRLTSGTSHPVGKIRKRPITAPSRTAKKKLSPTKGSKIEKLPTQKRWIKTQLEGNDVVKCNLEVKKPIESERKPSLIATQIISNQQLVSDPVVEPDLKDDDHQNKHLVCQDNVFMEEGEERGIELNCMKAREREEGLDIVTGFDEVQKMMEPMLGNYLYLNTDSQDESKCNSDIDVSFDGLVDELCYSSTISSFLDEASSLENTVGCGYTSDDTVAYDEDRTELILPDKKIDFHVCHDESERNTMHLKLFENDEPISSEVGTVDNNIHADPNIKGNCEDDLFTPTRNSLNCLNDVTNTVTSKNMNRSAKEENGNIKEILKERVTRSYKRRQMKKDFEVGKLIIGKIGRIGWWFGKIIKNEKPAENGSFWVYWYGDHDILQMPLSSLVPYTEFPLVFNKSRLKQKKYKQAVSEFLDDASQALSFSTPKELPAKKGTRFQNLLVWALGGFQTGTLIENELSENQQKFDQQDMKGRNKCSPKNEQDEINGNFSSVNDISSKPKETMIANMNDEKKSCSTSINHNEDVDQSILKKTTKPKNDYCNEYGNNTQYLVKGENLKLITDTVEKMIKEVGREDGQKGAGSVSGVTKKEDCSNKQNLPDDSDQLKIMETPSGNIPHLDMDNGISMGDVSDLSKQNTKKRKSGIDLDLSLLNTVCPKRRTFVDATKSFSKKNKRDKSDASENSLSDEINLQGTKNGTQSKHISHISQKNSLNNPNLKKLTKSLPPTIPKPKQSSTVLAKKSKKKLVFNVGDLIIAKVKGFDWWFGKLVDYKEYKLSPPNTNCSWIYWFGDHAVSEIFTNSLESIFSFSSRFDKHRMNKRIYKKSVEEVLNETALRCEIPFPEDKSRLSCLVEWAMKGFKPSSIHSLYNMVEIEDDQLLLNDSQSEFVSSIENTNELISNVNDSKDYEEQTEMLLNDSGISVAYDLSSFDQLIDFEKKVNSSEKNQRGTKPDFDMLDSSTPRRKTFADAKKNLSTKTKRMIKKKKNMNNSRTLKDTDDLDRSNMNRFCVKNNDSVTERSKKGDNKSRKDETLKPQVPMPMICDKDTTKDFKVGDLVIAKLGNFDWWFGKVVSHKVARQREPFSGHCWVHWFGDHKVSEMLLYSLESLAKFPQRFLSKKLTGVYAKAVREVLSDAASRCLKDDLPDDNSPKGKQDRLTQLVDWAMNGFLPTGVDPIYAKSGSNDHTRYDANGDSDDSSKDIEDPKLCEAIKMKFDSVATGKRNIEELCLACGDAEVEVAHPLFEGGLCKECKESFMECAFLYDDEGYMQVCSICSDGQEIILCDQPGCLRSYCTVCIDMFCGVGYSCKISRESGNWDCFMCTGERVNILKRRENWQERLKDIFQSKKHDINFPPPVFYETIPTEDRKPLRVLALFDGIATGYYALKEVGLEIELYIAAEIEPDAINVAKVQHGDRIRHVGDVREIYKQQLDEWGPFDLLIGGSPCNDLSIANPLKKGVYEGTGRLFFEFYRIKELLLPQPLESKPFFWLFENVVGMRHEDREVITRFLQCQPVMANSKTVSAQQRHRYFWGNLPGMDRQMYPLKSDKLTLQECLEPNCGRTAKLEKVRCITTMAHSLRQTKSDILPVKVSNSEKSEDGLWLTEIERIFGFPEHYTDVGNMGPRQRQKLLGKSWPVPVMRHLFTPLKNYFKTKSSDGSD